MTTWPLPGTIALGTGGSGDLGAGITRALAEAGVGVAVASLGNIDGAKKLAGEVEAAGVPHLLLEFEEKMFTFERLRIEVETFVESLFS